MTQFVELRNYNGKAVYYANVNDIRGFIPCGDYCMVYLYSQANIDDINNEDFEPWRMSMVEFANLIGVRRSYEVMQRLHTKWEED